MTLTRFSERALAMQGFARELNPSLPRIAPWLRFTPSLSTLWIATGTALASPAALIGFSLVSGLGASRKRHLFDLLYDRGVRPLVKGRALSENPTPRRFAMGLAGAWAATAATLFLTGHRRAGRIAGGLLTAAGLTVASTQFCVGSWLYRQLVRARLFRPPRAAFPVHF